MKKYTLIKHSGISVELVGIVQSALINDREKMDVRIETPGGEMITIEDIIAVH